MKASTFAHVLRDRRSDLAARWVRQFDVCLARTGFRPQPLAARLIPAAYDEIVALFAARTSARIPRRHHARAFAEMAPFPASASLCVEFFQCGAQVIGAFIVENSGPFAAWSTPVRNRLLGELDAIFHILVHREIEALCELRLDDSPGASVDEAPPFNPLTHVNANGVRASAYRWN